MGVDNIVTAAISLVFGFLGGFATIITMRNDIQMLKIRAQEDRELRDDMHEANRKEREAMQVAIQAELRELRQSQERHYMNLVSLLKDRHN